MIVVIDTTETFPDLRLEGPNFELLQAYLHDTSSSLAVPFIVFEETSNHFRERLSKAVKTLEASVREIEKLIGKPLISTRNLGLDQESELQKFRLYLEAQIKHLNGEIIPCEAVAVKALVERSLRRRKPFDGEGRKGFRDAVLWETLLRGVIEKGSAQLAVSLVTQNSRDFGEDQILSDDLREDLKEISRSEMSVTLFNGVKQFIDNVVKPHLEKLEAIQIQIQEGRYKDFDPEMFFTDFHGMIKSLVLDQFRRYDFDRLIRQAVGHFRAPDLHSLDNACSDYEVGGVWSIENGKAAVEIAYTVDGEIQCLERKEGLYPDGDEVFSEWYEDEYVGDATFKASMTVILDKESGGMEDFEVNDLDVTLGVRWPRDNYD